MLATHCNKVPTPLNTSVQELIRFLQASTVVRCLDLVKHEDIGTGKGKGHLAGNIYIAPPTEDQNTLADWTVTICNVSRVGHGVSLCPPR